MKRKQGSSSVSSRKLSKLGSSRSNFRAITRLETLATQASCWTKINRVFGAKSAAGISCCRLATLLPRKDERCVTTQKTARYACVEPCLPFCISRYFAFFEELETETGNRVITVIMLTKALYLFSERKKGGSQLLRRLYKTFTNPCKRHLKLGGPWKFQ